MIDQRIKTMTVNQLIEKLQALPEDQKEMIVAHYNNLEEAYNLPTEVKVMTFSGAGYVKSDYPWLYHWKDAQPEGSFIEIS